MKHFTAEIMRRLLRLVLTPLFRIRVSGVQHFDDAGKRVLVVSNHVSFLDGILLGTYLPKLPMFVINTYMAMNWWVRPFLSLVDYVKIDPTNPLYVKTLIRAIEQDRPVVIFPEGRITVTGSLMKMYQGPGLVADKTGASILPVLLDGPQYSYFSRLGGVVRRSLFPPIRIVIQPARKLEVGDAGTGHSRRVKAGHAMEDIMRDMVFEGSDYRHDILHAVLKARSIHGGRHIVFEDINRKPVSYNALLRAAFALAGKIGPGLNNQYSIGIMLPNAIALVATFLSVHLMGKAPAMINFTMGRKGVSSAIRTASISTVLTSRKFVEQAGLGELVDHISQQVKVVYLEDVRETINAGDKLSALLSSWFPGIAVRMKGHAAPPDETAVILFTSGSEGAPKGVVLSHANLLSNREQLSAVLNFTSNDVMLNAMPLFHSFGLLAGMILPLTMGIRCFQYPSPLHYNVIPELSYDIRATIIFGTSTFLSGYARKAHPYDFNEIRLAIAGAERLQDETRRQWFEKFGIRILEGYGATETSPVVAINTPMHCRNGTVGRLLPGMQYYLAPVEGIKTGGRLVVKGPNIMRGYLFADDPGVLHPPETERGSGWYDTGDIVTVDERNYITILGRAKRFAKIAGEMVSLTQVEQLARDCWPDAMHAAVAIPDEKKGEQLVLFTNNTSADRAALLRCAHDAGISELAVPRLIHMIDDIPLLGTGKIDYNRIEALAIQRKD